MASRSFKKTVMVDLSKEIKRREKEVQKIIFNAVAFAQEINEERVDTGFMINNWYFDTQLPTGGPLKRPLNTSSFPDKTSRTLRNLRRYKMGDVGYIINNVEYASFHDLGTINVYPLFLSFQVQTYIEREINNIK